MRKIKKPKMIKNKKGAISGIISSIGHTIQAIFTTIPKPVLFLIFLAILLLMGAIMPILFQSFGTFCDSANNPVSTGVNVFNNIALMSYKPDPDLINTNTIKLNKVLFLSEGKHTSCSELINEGTITFADGTEINITSLPEPIWVYDGTYCTECEEVTITGFSPNIFAGVNKGDLQNGVCQGDVYRINDEQKSWLKKLNCGQGGECEPPPNYYYDSELNRYICDGNDCEGTTAGQDWDSRLRDKGAKPIYTSPTGISIKHTGFIGIKCREIKPRLAVFKIEVFDYRLWIIIMIIFIGFWALKEFG